MINFIEEAQRLIRINSVTQNGNEEAAVQIQGLMNSIGMKTVLQEVSHSIEGVSKRQFNVVGIMGDTLVDPTTRKGLLLLNHIDTIDPGLKTYWTETGNDPFNMTIKDNKIYGLGTAAGKLDILCKLKAAERYRERKLKYPLYIAGTAAEEIGMLGAKYLMKSRVVNPAQIVVGEPSDLSIVSKHKAAAIYQLAIEYSQIARDAKGFNTKIEVRCLGKSAHASDPKQGQNAIERMLDIINLIREANFQFRLSKLFGGDAPNKVPDTAGAELFISSSSFDDFRKFFREKLNEKGIEVDFGGLGDAGLKALPDGIFDSILMLKQGISELDKTILQENDSSFDPPQSTLSFGKLASKQNLVEMWIDVRLLPSISIESFDLALKQKINEVNAKFTNLKFRMVKTRSVSALNIQEGTAFLDSALEIQKSSGINKNVLHKSNSSEAAQFSAAGYDVIAFGPGKSKSNSHCPNEYNIVEELDLAVQFYDRMIERYCL